MQEHAADNRFRSSRWWSRAVLSLLASGSSVAALGAEPDTAQQNNTRTQVTVAPLSERPALFELGVFGGVLFPSADHELLSRGPHEAYATPISELGARFAFLPLRHGALELEGAALPGKTDSGDAAGLWAARGHLLGQIPLPRWTPFILAGFGVLGAGSNTLGSDADPSFHFGAGVKMPLDRFLSARLDVRDTLAQRYRGGTGAQTHFPEILLGLTFVLGPARPVPDTPVLESPDTDGDGFIDEKDACPVEAGFVPCGCPFRDADGDRIIDEFDRCPQQAGTSDGCPDPDLDRDRITVPADRCPEQVETINGYEDEDGCPDEVPVNAASGLPPPPGSEPPPNGAPQPPQPLDPVPLPGPAPPPSPVLDPTPAPNAPAPPPLPPNPTPAPIPPPRAPGPPAPNPPPPPPPPSPPQPNPPGPASPSPSPSAPAPPGAPRSTLLPEHSR